MEKINEGILAKIFINLDFRSLMAAEMVCRKWKNTINENRLYWIQPETPHHLHLNNDVLEKIFTFLNFRSLIVAEMVCKRWKEIICDRRLFWQLSKKLCRASKRKLPMSITFDSSNFRKEQKRLKQHNKSWPSRRKDGNNHKVNIYD